MTRRRFTREFKLAAVRLVRDQDVSVSQAARDLDIHENVLRKWVKAYENDPGHAFPGHGQQKPEQAEVTALKQEIRKLKAERDILKKAAVLCAGVRVKYRFINDHRHEYKVATMCRVLRVSRSGFYKWLHQPLSDRAIEDRQPAGADPGRLCSQRRRLWFAACLSGSAGGRRNLRQASRGAHQKAHKIKALRGYKAPRAIAGRPSIIASNTLDREFTVDRPEAAWVTDITYLRTWQGWLYLAVVLDLYSRKVAGWSMKPTLARELVLDALIMAVWRRRPKHRVMIHSDQGSQYGSDDWLRLLKANNLEPSMSRRGNCWDNAVAESFFSRVKKERIKKRIYKTRDLARADAFDDIESFYNRSRRHSHLGGVSPEAFERASL